MKKKTDFFFKKNGKKIERKAIIIKSSFVKKLKILNNYSLLKKINLSKICRQFYIFHEVLGKDFWFLTDHHKLLNVSIIKIENGSLIESFKNNEIVSFYSISDMIDMSDYGPNVIYYEVYVKNLNHYNTAINNYYFKHDLKLYINNKKK